MKNGSTMKKKISGDKRIKDRACEKAGATVSNGRFKTGRKEWQVVR